MCAYKLNASSPVLTCNVPRWLGPHADIMQWSLLLLPLLLLLNQSAESLKEVKRLNQLLAALEAASAGDASALLVDNEDDGESLAGGLGGMTGVAGIGLGGAASVARTANKAVSKVNLTEVRLQLQRQLKQQVSICTWQHVSALRRYVRCNGLQACLLGIKATAGMSKASKQGCIQHDLAKCRAAAASAADRICVGHISKPKTLVQAQGAAAV
eukprot:GHRR01028046.1.p1 GENE.GHRR01028046.1~~GHRR01028046.1.p1  ORF type:complete len:213 (+),score=74.99 GHRR01028046.1:1798-2436(+)